MTPRPVALTVAGSDPSGGAGLQADLKTFHHFGVYGEAVVTLITVQNTCTVSAVEILPSALVAAQIRAVVADIPPQAAKLGALGNADLICATAAELRAFPFPIVLDPVMITKHGARLLGDEAVQALMTELLPRCTLITPNVPEAELLTGMEIVDLAQRQEAAQRLRNAGAGAVLIKGGHLPGAPDDVLLAADGSFHVLAGTRVNSPHTHGTGCTYAAAITALLAHGQAVPDAVQMAKRYIQAAIQTAPGLGHGHGPVNHFAPIPAAATN